MEIGTRTRGSFRNSKIEYTKKLRVYHLKYKLPFILRMDASTQRFAGVLVQEQNGEEVSICFISRVIIICCVNKLCFYLLGNKFSIEIKCITGKFNKVRTYYLE